MNKPPERIWLQYYGDGSPDDDPNAERGEVSWCETKVFENDIEYVRVEKP